MCRCSASHNAINVNVEFECNFKHMYPKDCEMPKENTEKSKLHLIGN